MFDLASFLPRAVMQGIPLLYGSTGEILTEKSGNLNLGIPGVMYVGGICGVIGAFFYEQSTSAANMNAFLAIGIPMLCSLLGSLLMGLLYCLLTVTLRANQNVTGLALTTFGVGIGNFFGGSLIKLTDSEVPSIALSATSAYFSKSLRLPAVLVISSMRLTEEIAARASPRKPMVAMAARSSAVRSLEVAWRRKAVRASSRDIPQPLSVTRRKVMPPSRISSVTLEAPASTAFSSSSLATEAGRSTTSPAAMRLAI